MDDLIAAVCGTCGERYEQLPDACFSGCQRVRAASGPWLLLRLDTDNGIGVRTERIGAWSDAQIERFGSIE